SQDVGPTPQYRSSAKGIGNRPAGMACVGRNDQFGHTLRVGERVVRDERPSGIPPTDDQHLVHWVISSDDTVRYHTVRYFESLRVAVCPRLSGRGPAARD